MGRLLNVLVYCGPGATAGSVRHCLASLRRVLAPNYAVIPIAESALLKEPWEPTCALLVFPGGADLGYCRVLNGTGNARIRDFVRHGGSYLGFCAGGYYASQMCEFELGNPELEVIGGRELAFFPGICRGGAYPGFAYNSERGAKAVNIHVPAGVFGAHDDFPAMFSCYYNGGGVFVNADKKEGVDVLAEYYDPPSVDTGEGAVQAAAVYCQVGHGAAILTGPHPEFDPALLDKNTQVIGYKDLINTLTADDVLRNEFLKACLSKLGLEVDPEEKTVPTLSEMHLTSLSPKDKAELLDSLKEISTEVGGEKFIAGESDVFRLEEPEDSTPLDWEKNDQVQRSLSKSPASQRGNATGRNGTPDPTAEFNNITKRIVCHDSNWPAPTATRHFSHSLYYHSLENIRLTDTLLGSKWIRNGKWGKTFMYGEVVTSTNSLLDKNPKLLDKLPTGFTLAATTQLAGRGRGSNVWVAPAGSLLMSTVINHPASCALSHPIVFIQYIAAIAIVQAIKSYRPECADLPVRLKWPNDIYAQDPTKPDDKTAYVKIGGILSTCSYARGTYQIVLGIGLNVNNARPTTSLDALLNLLPKTVANPNANLQPFRIEDLMARILVRLEGLYSEFLGPMGFSSEMERLYYEHWLHGGQLVTIAPEGGGVQGRVVGITRDWGMLKVEEVVAGRGTGVVWALQSDENSFDFWRGLIKRRV